MNAENFNSPIALIGGETSTEGFKETHLRLIDLARSTRSHPNHRPVHVVYLVTCASHDGVERVNYLRERAQKNLGAMGLRVSTPPVTDQQSANDSGYARLIADADWIYFSGGHPHVGMEILSGNRVLEAILSAWKRGALLSGSSAGAMILCSHSIIITPELNVEIERLIQRGEGLSDWDMPLPTKIKCLGLVPHSMCWPHMNVAFSPEWAQLLLANGQHFIGVDEQTAAVRDTSGKWQVWGKGQVVVGSQNALSEYPAGSDIDQMISPN